MGVQGGIPARFEDVFPAGVIVMAVGPVEDFELKKAGNQDPQERDKESGLRLWAVTVIDPSARVGSYEVKVKVAAEHQPVPPAGIGGQAVLESLVVVPWLDDRGQRPRIKYSYRAAGFAQATARKAAA